MSLLFLQCCFRWPFHASSGFCVWVGLCVCVCGWVSVPAHVCLNVLFLWAWQSWVLFEFSSTFTLSVVCVCFFFLCWEALWAAPCMKSAIQIKFEVYTLAAGPIVALVMGGLTELEPLEQRWRKAFIYSPGCCSLLNSLTCIVLGASKLTLFI